ncbi:hypothetical protein EMPS_09649 [Entomortierella parvispora]|uniref:RNA helicase n=1 Tax=Entomortierella parvispora TaxID=205924 RepID=A0A9P3M0S9_9FUNG|nr:hypothetical protein EMPS_09649 [Entomortierella parvispora]
MESRVYRLDEINHDILNDHQNSASHDGPDRSSIDNNEYHHNDKDHHNGRSQHSDQGQHNDKYHYSDKYQSSDRYQSNDKNQDDDRHGSRGRQYSDNHQHHDRGHYNDRGDRSQYNERGQFNDRGQNNNNGQDYDRGQYNDRHANDGYRNNDYSQHRDDLYRDDSHAQYRNDGYRDNNHAQLRNEGYFGDGYQDMGRRDYSHIDPGVEDLPWGSDKPVYEWQQDYTESSAPADLKLEKELFDDERRVQAQPDFHKRNQNDQVRLKGGPDPHIPITDFKDVGLDPTIVDNVTRMQYSEPTPIQKNAIPLILDGYDLMACAQTGSGKTAAYLLPILSKVLVKVKQDPPIHRQPGARRSKAAPLALIILPTRELAVQIFDDSRRFTYKSRVRPVVIYGGAELGGQKEQLARGCDVLIATPGRLLDSLERGAVTLAKVRYLVLDEADRILDLGFEPMIRHILLSPDFVRDGVRPDDERIYYESDEHGVGAGIASRASTGSGAGLLQTLMFSATFPSEIQMLARDFLKDEYCRLRIGRIGGTTENIFQNVILVDEHEKEDTLIATLSACPPARTLVFVATKRKADYLDDTLFNLDFPCVSLHGDRTQRERELALEAFRRGKSPIMIATAVAARGLDIKDIMHVINYDLCRDIDDYVQRIGRTARAGHRGLATTFFSPSRDWDIAPALTKLLVECEQPVPDFLEEYIPENSSYDNDFIDLGALSVHDDAPAANPSNNEQT